MTDPKIESLSLQRQSSKSGGANTLVRKCRSTLHFSIKNKKSKIEDVSPENQMKETYKERMR